MRHIEVLLNATNRRVEQGMVIGVVGIGQDITARLAQEREYSKLVDTANAPTTRRDKQGNIIVVVGIGQDITGLLVQEREYSRLIDTADAPIFGVDTIGRVNVWNKCTSSLIGYSADEVMGRSLIQDFITDEFKTPVQTVLDQTAGDETDNFEFPLITKSGYCMEVLLNATSRHDEQGNVIGMMGMVQDITARLSQEREYSKLIDMANASIFCVNTKGAVNVWNQCAMKLVGYSTEEVIGKILVKEFITDEFKTAVQAVLDQALHGEETANFQFPNMTKGGIRLDVLLNATTS
jgi:PAS domain S-box-containing protein